jgi:hypothetical protein
VLIGPKGSALDAMAFDGNGYAAMVTRHYWLTTRTNEWTAAEEPRMTLADRLIDLDPPGLPSEVTEVGDGGDDHGIRPKSGIGKEMTRLTVCQ